MSITKSLIGQTIVKDECHKNDCSCYGCSRYCSCSCNKIGNKKTGKLARILDWIELFNNIPHL